jgi:glycosyltransferase 2 family protein
VTETNAAPRGKGAWRSWVLRLFGIALLVWVLSRVGWHDSVVLADGTVVVGEIVGDVPHSEEAGETIRFRGLDAAETAAPRPIRLADLAQDDVSGEKYARVNEGIFRIVRRSDRWLLAAGLLLFGAVSQIGVLRWKLLLRAQGILLRFAEAHRLTFIGFFFNNVVPGPTGGDVIKAVYVARGTERRAPAVMTVVVDRVLGLVALALIALFALLTQLDNPKFRELSWFVFGFLGCIALGMVVFFSRRVRRVIRLDAIVARLPAARVIQKADEAMFAWRNHKGALVVGLLMSFANQLALQVMMWIVAAGLHVTTRTGGGVSALDYMIVLPVAFIASSLPVLPGGWGLRETAFAVCFHFIGVDRNPAVALSVMFGMTQTAWGLLGGVYFLLGRAAGEFREVPGAAAEPGPAVPAAASGPSVPPGN